LTVSSTIVSKIGEKPREAVSGAVHQHQFGPGRLESPSDGAPQVTGRAGHNHHKV
jgi:hypothetical protein